MVQASGVTAMARVMTRNHEHFRRALKRLPLGVASNFRYWGEERTIYVREGRGARITDLDGNVYVDYRMGYGPAILGYADARVDAAARRGMEVGGVFALSTEAEYRVAQRIAKMVPAAELVRYSNSGTEAVMAGLRLARAYTRRDDYVILEGSYHGLFDAAMWYTPMDKWAQVGDPEVYPYSEGVPLSTRNFAHFVQANDANQLEDVLKRHGDSIACLLIEPIMGNCLGIAAEPAYVRAARALCDRYGVVMLIDEVKTGFRVARGGVQELYGVRADLCTFAKALANGYPISVLAGREHIMRKLGKGVAHGGTYTAHPVSLAAAEKTLEILDETDALATIAAYGTRLRAGKSAILKARGIAHSFVGHPSMTGLYFAHDPPRTYRDWKSSDYSFYDATARALHDERILCEPDSREPWFVSAAHDDACLKDTLAAFEVAVDRTLNALGTNRRVPA
jgi:glutamate-1-semialdehyde 2,1-aminomutase